MFKNLTFNNYLLHLLILIVPLNFFCRFFEIFDIGYILRVLVSFQLLVLFISGDKKILYLTILTIAVLCLNTYYKFSNQYFYYIILSGLIAFSSCLAFNIRREKIIDILQNCFSLYLLIFICSASVFTLGIICEFYLEITVRLTAPFKIDYYLLNPNQTGLYFFSLIIINTILPLKNRLNIILKFLNLLAGIFLTQSRQTLILMTVFATFWFFYNIYFLDKSKKYLQKIYNLILLVISYLSSLIIIIYRGDIIQEQIDPGGRIFMYIKPPMYNFPDKLNTQDYENLLYIKENILGLGFGVSTNSITRLSEYLNINLIKYHTYESTLFAIYNNGGLLLLFLFLFCYLKIFISYKKVNFLFLSIGFFSLVIFSVASVIYENFTFFSIFIISSLYLKYKKQKIND